MHQKNNIGMIDNIMGLIDNQKSDRWLFCACVCSVENKEEDGAIFTGQIQFCDVLRH